MQIEIGDKNKQDLLPANKQVSITLKTQEEVDQLYAILNFVPIRNVIDTKKSKWESLRKKLPISNKFSHWYNRLGETFNI